MASQYLLNKYKDVKPDEPRVLTPAEKRKNWWHYHWGWLLFAAVLVIALAFIIHDAFFRPVPDYHIAYVGLTGLPNEVQERLKENIAALGEDVNGDGRILVELTTYSVGFDDVSLMDVEAASAAITALTVELSSGDLYFLLLEDPAGFQARMGALAYLDGTSADLDDPTHGVDNWRDMVYLWSDCPVLSGMELGTYEEFLTYRELDGQDAVADLYIARRATRDEAQQDAFAGAELLWQRLTENAVPLP